MAQDERWAPIPGFLGYEISDQGRLRSFVYSKNLGKAPLGGRILKGGKDKDGYRRAVICTNGATKRARSSHKISRLVAEAFIGPRPAGMVLRHKNGNCADDRSSNLAYGSQKENIHDKFSHGTMPLGEKHVKAKLTEDAVRIIRASPDSTTNLAMRFNVSLSTISAVRVRRIWKHLD